MIFSLLRHCHLKTTGLRFSNSLCWWLLGWQITDVQFQTYGLWPHPTDSTLVQSPPASRLPQACSWEENKHTPAFNPATVARCSLRVMLHASAPLMSCLLKSSAHFLNTETFLHISYITSWSFPQCANTGWIPDFPHSSWNPLRGYLCNGSVPSQSLVVPTAFDRLSAINRGTVLKGP